MSAFMMLELVNYWVGPRPPGDGDIPIGCWAELTAVAGEAPTVWQRWRIVRRYKFSDEQGADK